ncbi:putative CDPK-related kinase 5 [Dishui Lake large algae virus 1]|nr:putative CDPK-related kinase 5 [Dishui Lake large algae virus 1]
MNALLSNSELIFKSSKSVVYRGTWKNNLVAIKQIPRRFCVMDQISLEVSAMQKLQEYENVVRFIDTVEYEDDIYIIMEWISGNNSKDYVKFREKPLTEQDVRNIIYQVASVLKNCNRLNLIYGDVKPENVMIERSGRVKLIDFGCTRPINSVRNCYMGTPIYFPPEMFDKIFVPQHDVWCLGLLAYYLACGEHPFITKYPGDFDALKKTIMNAPFGFQNPVWKDWSVEGKEIITGMLYKDPLVRLSIGDVYKHRWFDKASSSYDLLP